jgi:hypothetical protein
MHTGPDSNSLTGPHLCDSPVAELIDLDWGDKVNSGIGLFYRPARLHGLADRYDNPMPEFTFSPSHGSMNLSTGYQRVPKRFIVFQALVDFI